MRTKFGCLQNAGRIYSPSAIGLRAIPPETSGPAEFFVLKQINNIVTREICFQIEDAIHEHEVWACDLTVADLPHRGGITSDCDNAGTAVAYMATGM